MTDKEANLAKSIVSFCRFARTQGLSIGMQETLGALAATASLGIEQSDDLRAGLRSVLCSSKEDWDLFDEVFGTFWKGADASTPKQPVRRREGHAEIRNRQSAGALLSGPVASDASEETGSQEVTGASARERVWLDLYGFRRKLSCGARIPGLAAIGIDIVNRHLWIGDGRLF